MPCSASGSLRVTPARGREAAHRSTRPPRASRVRPSMKGHAAAPIDTARRGPRRTKLPRKTDARRTILRQQTPDGQHVSRSLRSTTTGAPVVIVVGVLTGVVVVLSLVSRPVRGTRTNATSLQLLLIQTDIMLPVLRSCTVCDCVW